MRKSSGNKITLMMLVRNEVHRYLEMVLEHLDRYVDEMVILDDCSTDGTVELCRRHRKVVRLESLPSPGFDNEVLLRKRLWAMTVETSPDWILALDADEMFEDRIVSELRSLVDQDRYDWVGFPLYDFWGSTIHYRDDAYWRAHRSHWIVLVRYLDDFSYAWTETPLHCGRLPSNIHLLPGWKSDIRLKHFGWVRREDQLAKYRRYMSLDPEGRYGWLDQYRSILDPDPHLVPWEE